MTIQQMGRHRIARVLLAIGFVAWAGCAAVAQAQEVAATATNGAPREPLLPTEADVQAQLEAARASTALDEAAKAQVVLLYTDALENLRSGRQWAERAGEYELVLRDGPDKAAELEKKLQAPREALEILPDTPLADLEQKMSEAEQNLADAQRRYNECETEIAARAERRKALPGLIAEMRQRLAEAPSAPTATSPASPQKNDAAALLEKVRHWALTKRLDACEKELASYDIRGRLLKLEGEIAQRDVDYYTARTATLGAALNARRAQEAIKARQDAIDVEAVAKRLEAMGATPEAVQVGEDLARETKKLVERRAGEDGTLIRLAEASKQRRLVTENLEKLRTASNQITQKVDAAGLSGPIGQLLRRQRSKLPDVRTYQRNIRARGEAIAQAQIDLIELNEQRMEFGESEAAVEALLEDLDSTAPENEENPVEYELRGLLQARRDALNALDEDYEAYFVELVDLDSSERALVKETAEFTAYIDERVLWIRSGSVAGWTHLVDGLAALKWLLTWRLWMEVLTTLGTDFTDEPTADLLLVVILAAYGLMRRQAGRRLREMGEKAVKGSCTTMWLTVEAAAATGFVAAFFPILLWVVGHRLSVSLNASYFAEEVGEGLKATAIVVFPFSFVRDVLRSFGLGTHHFGWPETAVQRLRGYLRWLPGVTAACTFVIILLQNQGHETWEDSLGRFALVAVLGAFGIFAHGLLRIVANAVPVLRGYLVQQRRIVLRILWYALGYAVPGTLIVLAWLGYGYTALRLSVRLWWTMALLIGIGLVRTLVVRWLLLVRRRLAIRQARQRRAALSEGKSDEPENEGDKADLAKLDFQTYRLVQIVAGVLVILGLWAVWVDELPALNVIKQVELWGTTQTIRETMTDANEVAHTTAREAVVPVTLADLIGAIVLVIVVALATTNLPGLLELAVLERLHVAGGERYAIKSIVRYLTILLGIVLVSQRLGISWSSIQWLVAAVGLGLGFGLQEIFANFVSGLIILFERPIRVGDTVTVGGITGEVRKIHMRATRITDFDRKELVVPNKEFVTNELVNWTLSDSVLRIIVRVGIAYGSDTKRAEGILYRVAREEPLVLDDPAPLVVFMEFGDSALNFELRCFCQDVRTWLYIPHTLHMAIDQAFREAGIVVAFPQRDVHIHSMPEPLRLPKPTGD